MRSTRISSAISLRSPAWPVTTCRRTISSMTGLQRQFGCNAGIQHTATSRRARPSSSTTCVTWTRGAHTLKVGMEYRKIMGNLHGNEQSSRELQLSAAAPPGCSVSIAEARSPASCSARWTTATRRSGQSTPSYPRQHAWIVHAGDTWRINDKFTLDYGLRWDYYSPSSEKYDVSPFSIPTGANPGAGGRPGPPGLCRRRLRRRELSARAIRRRTGTAGLRRGWAPCTRSTTRPCCAPAGASSTRRRSIRAGAAASRRTASRQTPSFSSTLGGVQPAFFLDQGLPQNFEAPPIIRSDYKNGQTISIGRLTPTSGRTHISGTSPVDRELVTISSLSIAYVGSAGRRLPSSIDPINAIDPAPLSMGQALDDEFEPGHDEPRRRAAAVSRAGSSR